MSEHERSEYGLFSRYFKNGHCRKLLQEFLTDLYSICLDAILYRLSNPTIGNRSTIVFKEAELKEVDDEYRRWKNG